MAWRSRQAMSASNRRATNGMTKMGRKAAFHVAADVSRLWVKRVNSTGENGRPLGSTPVVQVIGFWSQGIDDWRDGARLESMDENIRNAWAALKLVRMAIEQTCPAGVLPSEDAALLLYGPEPVHKEALAKAIIDTVKRLGRDHNALAPQRSRLSRRASLRIEERSFPIRDAMSRICCSVAPDSRASART